MAMDFPNSPTVNQTFTVGDKTWKWTGTVWEIVVNRPAMRSVADTPPANPIVGDEWFNSLTGRTYTWFDSYWIEVNTNSVVGASGLNGVASASAPLVYNSTNNNISLQSGPTITDGITTNAPGDGQVLKLRARASDNFNQIAWYNSGGTNFTGLWQVLSDASVNIVRNTTPGGTSQNFQNSISINPSGNVTQPFHPYIKVDGNNFNWYDLADGTAVNGSYVSPTYTRGGMSWNSSNGRITVPVAGCYEMSYTSYSTVGASRIHLRKNGGSFAMGHKYEASDAQRVIVGTVDAAANDYFDVLFESGVSHYYGGNHTYFTLKLIG